MYKKKKRFVFVGKRSKNEKRFVFIGKNNIPNKLTVETLEKSDKGEDLYRADNIEQLFNELRKKEIKGSDRFRIFESGSRDE